MKPDINSFVKELHSKNEVLIKEVFRLTDEFDTSLYHYTNSKACKEILESKCFHASLLTSTSDPLEFCGPFTYCRNWLCTSGNFINYPEFPLVLFQHFNREAIYPDNPAYFISFSKNDKNNFLKKAYGENVIRFECNEKLKFALILECLYTDDVNRTIAELLARWRIENFEPAARKYKIAHPMEYLKDWLHTLIGFCNFISIGIKDKMFQEEAETRIIFFPFTYPEQLPGYFGEKDTKSVRENSLLVREYIPINLNKFQINIF